MDFDGAVNKGGAVAGVWIFDSNSGRAQSYCYKINFQCTNNIVEYEALMLGLQILKISGVKRISIHGFSELIINQIKGEYSAKHPRLREYRNFFLDLLQCFLEY